MEDIVIFLCNLFSSIASGVESFNRNYATAALFVISVFTLWYLFREYNLNKRPLVFVTPTDEEINNGGLNFFAKLKNYGKYPATVNVKKIGIKVGDNENVESEAKEIFDIAPLKEDIKVSFGNVSGADIQKLVDREFNDNRCIIYIELRSGSFTEKKLNHKSEFSFEVIFTRGVAEYKPLVRKIT